MTPTGDERVAIISTSINVGERTSYAAWAAQGDLVVAGDVTTPDSLESYVGSLGGVYLTPGDQERHAPVLSASIGWRSIQRRNLALLYALEHGYDYVVSVDDDNVPTDDFVAAHVAVVRDHCPPDTPRVSSDTRWVNSADFVNPPTVQRGTPHSRLSHGRYTYHIAIDVQPVVSQGHVLGDPDVGAATRIMDDPRTESVERGIVVRPHDDQWLAFNSQATVWHGSWAHYAAVPPALGRYDDIFGSFFLEYALRPHAHLGVHVGPPAVTQHRNEHDVRRDLRHEVIGMELTLPLVDALSRVNRADERYVDVVTHVAHLLPPATVEFAQLWSDELRRLKIEE